MDRRTFLALLSAPAFASLVQSCGDGDGAIDHGGTVTGNGFTFLTSSQARAAGTDAEAASGARVLNTFGARLYGALSETSEPNIVFSPLSMMVALAMTRAGASGATASEMDTVLASRDAAGSSAGFHRAVNAMSAAVESRNGTFTIEGEELPVAVSIANSLWGQDGVTWKPEFLDVLAVEYGAGMRAVDYVGRMDEARRAINGWVDDETKGRIPELLGEGVLTDATRLVLVNAVYMKAPWMSPFPVAGTRDGVFRTLDGSSATVPVMHSSTRCGYSNGANWQAVDLPYVGGALSMTLIVPDDGAWESVESSVSQGLIDDVVASLSFAEVNLGLPTFDLESKVDMKPLLAGLGMRTAFDPTSADFSGMTDDVELFINFVVHQANITVDEKGTEAAAATAVGAGATATPIEPVTLEIDRPFLYAVRDQPTGAVLFLGRVGDPR